MIFFACVACRATHCLLRALGFGASTFPGAAALKICPDILGYAARNVSVVAVTGTNGKTTTSRIIERALLNSGHRVCANRSGANLMPGITAELILNLGLNGKAKCPYAVIECDEAACRSVLGLLRPRVLVITNLFRDQLDRYGTVAYARDCIAAGLRTSPETVAVINADCPMAASVAEECSNRALMFGLGNGRRTAVGSGEDDSCPRCGAHLRYNWLSYASLGSFSCACGFSRREPDICADDVMPDGSFILRSAGGTAVCRPALPGLYNIYNAIAAAGAAVGLGEELRCAAEAIERFDCGFGRMESFALGKRGGRMILIKNAAAADQTLEQVRQYGEDKSIVFAVNARTADGTDISWLDDADMGTVASMRGLKRVYVCGDCAEEVRKRLGRENILCKCANDYDKLIDMLQDEEAFVFILPTYTAMLELREKLVKRLGGKNFWE